MKLRMFLFPLVLAVAARTSPGQSCPLPQSNWWPADGDVSDFLGVSVALAGPVILAGAPSDDDSGTDSGSVRLFDAAGGAELGAWLASDGAAGDGFGSAVAVWGTSAVVTAPWDDDLGADSGSAYVFDTGTGQELAKLVPADGAAGDRFGTSAALFGTTAVLGAPYGGGGSVYVFDATTGQQLAKLLPDALSGPAAFGYRTAVSATTVVVGAPWDAEVGANMGAVYLFDAATGVQQAKLLPDPASGVGVQFGASVALEGPTLIVGAPFEDAAFTNSGAAYLFDADSGSELARLVPADPAAQDWFGNDVGLSGATVVVGSPGDDGAAAESGSVYLFDRATGQELGMLVGQGVTSSSGFGSALALDDSWIVCGARGDWGAAWTSGSVYVFDRRPPPCAYCTAKANSQGCPTAVTWAGVPSLSDPGPFDVGASPVINRRNGLLFYGTSGPAAIPLSGGTLCAAPPLRRTGFQHSFGSPPPAVDCTGAFSFDFNALAQSGADPFLVAGQQVNAQYWWRDPANPDGTGVVLTEGLELFLAP